MRQYKIDVNTKNSVGLYGLYMKKWWGWKQLYSSHDISNLLDDYRMLAKLPYKLTDYDSDYDKLAEND